jgi:hypothetical protein
MTMREYADLTPDKIDEDLDRGDERELFQIWRLYGERAMWAYGVERLRRRAAETDDDAERETAEASLAKAQDFLAELPACTPLQALRANKRLIDLLTGRRWSVMQEAREQDASWAEVGDALGMSKQGAQDWYSRKIAEQEKYVPDFHDAARARAVLDEADHVR